MSYTVYVLFVYVEITNRWLTCGWLVHDDCVFGLSQKIPLPCEEWGTAEISAQAAQRCVCLAVCVCFLFSSLFLLAFSPFIVEEWGSTITRKCNYYIFFLVHTRYYGTTHGARETFLVRRRYYVRKAQQRCKSRCQIGLLTIQELIELYFNPGLNYKDIKALLARHHQYVCCQMTSKAIYSLPETDCCPWERAQSGENASPSLSASIAAFIRLKCKKMIKHLCTW